MDNQYNNNGVPPAQPYNQGYYTPAGSQAPTPTEIYNASQNGTPQYHYGMPMPGAACFNNAYYEEQRQKYIQRKNAEKKLRSMGNLTGATLIGCLIIAFVFSFLLVVPSVYDFYDSGLAQSSFINIIYTLAVVGGTLLLFDRVYKSHNKQLVKETGGVDAYEFKTKYSAPKNPLQAFLLIIISFGGCMAANYVTSILLTFLEAFGLYSTYSSIDDPKNIADILGMCISIAVMPPLIEEFAVRGVLMSHLRRYGNAFAIITSAFFFGLFHGDAAQIPFAFMCGIFTAYAVIATESLWTGIIIHAMNNSLSCISSVIMQVADEETANIFFYVVSVGGILLAVACAILYYVIFKDDGVLKYKGDESTMPLSKKLSKFFSSPLMIVAIILYLLQSLMTLTTKG